MFAVRVGRRLPRFPAAYLCREGVMQGNESFAELGVSRTRVSPVSRTPQRSVEDGRPTRSPPIAPSRTPGNRFKSKLPAGGPNVACFYGPVRRGDPDARGRRAP